MQYNGVHPQRRKMYQISKIHNLKSNVDFLWLNSLNHPEPVHDHVLKQKKHQNSSGDKYNQFIQSKISEEFKPLNSRTIEMETINRREWPVSLDKSRVMRNKSFDSNYDTLNQQVDAFNSSRSIGDQKGDRRSRQTYILDADLMKQLNLRSSLDKPEYSILEYQDESPRDKKFKNIIPDTLQNHLRPNFKPRRRY